MDVSRSSRMLLASLLFILLSGCARVAHDNPAERAELVLHGYDVVAYFGLAPDAEAVPGLLKYEYVWDGLRYRFASRKNMKAFQKDPARYAPRFGNYCASALAYGIPGGADPNVWRIRNGRLYIFGNVNSRNEYDQDVQGVIRAAERNYARRERKEPLMPEKALTEDTRNFLKFMIADGQRILDNQPVSSPAPATEAKDRP